MGIHRGGGRHGDGVRWVEQRAVGEGVHSGVDFLGFSTNWRNGYGQAGEDLSVFLSVSLSLCLSVTFSPSLHPLPLFTLALSLSLSLSLFRPLSLQGVCVFLFLCLCLCACVRARVCVQSCVLGGQIQA
eukprot:COSAG05_NODE_5497_length_1158_cov_338.242682_1_plen_129_part_00